MVFQEFQRLSFVFDFLINDILVFQSNIKALRCVCIENL